MERVLKLLENFGFSRVEAKVYLYLTKAGIKSVKDLAEDLKMTTQKLYPILKELQRKGAVTYSSEYTTMFSAITFEELLNLQIKLNTKNAQIIKKNKEKSLASWRNMIKKNSS
jgi:HTH-type transcriptional regulator, sugar sensing transcriptional regulator